MNDHTIDLDLPPHAARAALAAAAEAWNAEWLPDERGGQLGLPLVYGLRRGVAIGQVELVRLGDERTRVTWTFETQELAVHRQSVAVLLFAALPLVASLAWPLYPPLLALAPFGAVTGFLAWWLVVSRLRSYGPAEFFSALRESDAGAVG